MNRAVSTTIPWAIVLVLMTTGWARAQVESGTVAAVQGAFEVQHGGNWQTATIGLPVFTADRLRTGPDGRGKVVFQDDSVLDLAPGTEIVLDTQVFEPDARRWQSLLRLFNGKIRAWVSDYYRQAHARYEVETPTAVAGVRGTEFIAAYNPTAELTEVVGIADEVEVAGKLAVIGAVVQVGPRSYTQVKKGRLPTAPQPLDDARFRQFLEGLELMGTGRRDGLNVLHPLVVGHLQAPQDVAQTAAASELGARAPQEFLGDRLSPDIYTNTQPLQDYQATPPGQVPPGSVKVAF
jgi:hypothetical protein